MTGTFRKTLLLAGKLILAAGLLGWVFSQVHWGDYVRGRDGREYNLADLPGADAGHLAVYTGSLWWKSPADLRPAGDFVPVSEGSGAVRRPGFFSTMFGVNVPLVVSGGLGLLVGLLIVAVRWRMLLRIQDIHIGLWESVRLTFLGHFFNAVVPGTVGGDLVKAYYVSRHTPHKAAVLVSVFVDRMMGLAELTAMAGAILAAVWLAGLEDPVVLRVPAVMVGVMAAGVTGVMLFVLSSRFRSVFRLQKIYGRLSIARHIAAAGDAAVLYRRRLGVLMAAFLMTIAAHVSWIGSLGLLGASLSLPAAWYSYFVYIPLIYIIGSVPLTPGGVGLVEKFYVVFFTGAGCTPSAIMGLALLSRLIPMVWGLPGLVVALAGPGLPKAAAVQAELGLGETSETPGPNAGAQADSRSHDGE